MQNSIRTEAVFQGSISMKGLFEATFWVGSVCFVFTLSLMCAILFWHIRAWIPSSAYHSYKSYVIWLDSSIFGTLPSLWIQKHFQCEFLDIIMRAVWFSYGFVIIFGSTFVFILRGQVQRHVLSVILTLSAGLFIHYILPTQPPWMAVEEVIRINGDQFTNFDKNLVAAMPSIHQAIICLAGCALWQYGIFGRLMGISYSVAMASAIIYLGEHFLADCVGALFIAIASWLLAEKILVHWRKWIKKI